MESNKITNEMDGSSDKTEYKYLEEDINSLEILESTNNISEWGTAKLNEFRMIKRQLEILDILKTKLIDSYYRDETDEGEIEA